MSIQQVGYRRVSSHSQRLDRQMVNVELDRCFDETISSREKDRPELEKCLEHLREGDTLHVHSIDRLCRSITEMETILEGLLSKGVTVKIHKGNLTFTGNDNPMDRLLLQVMSVFSQFEREIIRERQREGIEKAKERGVYKGKQHTLDATQIQELKKRVQDGEKITNVGKLFGISRSTVYRYLKK